MINGNTELIAHIGYPTHTFKSPMIYNPYFEEMGINAVVIPMGCKPENFGVFLNSVFHLTNIRGALITMPHKVTTAHFLKDISPTARVAGACNAVRRTSDGLLQGDMFDGEGFVRGIQRKGLDLRGKRALVVGSGGVGGAIAASLAKAQVAQLHVFDMNESAAQQLTQRIKQYFPKTDVADGSNNPRHMDLVVNATPLGMKEDDPLPFDVSLLHQDTFVGEVVLKNETTALLKAAAMRGCKVQVGVDMLFEQIPAYLEYFGFKTTTPEVLREIAQLRY